MDNTDSITTWLDNAREGDRAALDRVLGALYSQLHQMAARQLKHSGDDETLHPTALVNEAWLRLAGGRVDFTDRSAFFTYAATAMRSVVVDHARSRVALKRGGGDAQARLSELPDAAHDGLRLDEDLLSLDSALAALGEVDPDLARLVELRYFAGLSEAQIAELTSRSERTVRRDWQKARLFLLQALEGHS